MLWLFGIGALPCIFLTFFPWCFLIGSRLCLKSVVAIKLLDVSSYFAPQSQVSLTIMSECRQLVCTLSFTLSPCVRFSN